MHLAAVTMEHETYQPAAGLSRRSPSTPSLENDRQSVRDGRISGLPTIRILAKGLNFAAPRDNFLMKRL